MIDKDSVILVEITGYVPDLEGTAVFRFADAPEIVTRPTETPANTTYFPRLDDAGNFERHLYKTGTTRGTSETGYGQVIINNADGKLDMAADYGFDGRPIVIRRGKRGNPYPSGWPVIFSGTIYQPEFTDTTVVFTIRDKQAELLTTLVQSERFAGSNVLPDGVEGTASDLGGKTKPFFAGVVRNIAPPVVNTSKQTLQLNTQTIQSIEKVRMGGVEVPVGNAYTTLTDLQAASVATNTYDYYLGDDSDGAYIRIGSDISGRITVDATQGATDTDRTVAQICNQILVNSGGITGGFTSDSIAALDDFSNAQVGIYIGEGNELKVGQVLDTILESVHGWWTTSLAGEYILGHLQFPEDVTPSAILTISALLRDSLQILGSNDSDGGVPAYQVTLSYDTNYTVQTDSDLFPAAAQDFRTYAAQQYRTVVSTNSDTLTKHLLAPQVDVSSLFIDSDAAQAQADYELALYTPEMYTLVYMLMDAAADEVEPGDVVTVQNLNRYGVTGPRNAYVLGRIDQYKLNQVSLYLWMRLGNG